ncbi:MAG: hypothetical protein AAF483_18460 [Planctomycetota bacterium]
MFKFTANGSGKNKNILWPQMTLLCSVAFYTTHCSLANAQTQAEKPKQVSFQSEKLESAGDIASEMVAGMDRFLLRKIEQSSKQRKAYWKKGSEGNTDQFLADNRKKLSEILGVPESERCKSPRVTIQRELDEQTENQENALSLRHVAWPALRDPRPGFESLCSIHGEGLLLSSVESRRGTVIVLPDVDCSPERACGIAPGLAEEKQIARQLARHGYQVVVPCLISRDRISGRHKNNLTQREFLHRSAFELGRLLSGYEIQKVLALVDAIDEGQSITLIGQGEGGRLALFAAALDERIDQTVVVGSFGSLENIWREPLDRTIFGLLNYFDASDLAGMIAPRQLVIGTFDYQSSRFSGQGGAAPAEILQPDAKLLKEEVEAATEHFATNNLQLTTSWRETLQTIVHNEEDDTNDSRALSASVLDFEQNDAEFVSQRQERQFLEIDRHNQLLLAESSFVREQRFANLDFSSVEAYSKATKSHREFFRERVIGSFPDKLIQPAPRSRASWESDKWTGHEVVLDVFPDVIAYGVLLLPKDLEPGEKRPVVVCQHGLEGRPTDTFVGDHRAYHDFAAKICNRGFIVFAPQNPYIFRDRFRTLQRKANSIGKTLFSLIVPQHQQIVNWLKELEFVDQDRIAFYGLSYGGKSAMRIPALVEDYCLSICSADFNEWVLKNASTRHRFSYVWTGEYEIFEWNLGSTFNYYEMAALICPRPFMVERGHFDGVGKDEWVAFEYAKVRHLYAAKLGIADRTEIEWFAGPHTIHGQGTFAFLHKHLRFPPR